MTRKTWSLLTVLILIGLFFLLPALFVFASGGTSNPSVENQVTWDSSQTKALFYRACADCHSNETTWPWYSKIPPVSALTVHDVSEGRSKFNISARDMGKADEAAETVQKGEMPMKIYTIMHPTARLTDTERQALAAGLQKTFGGEN